MGKNYTDTNYKKTYGENYVKSYGNRRVMKQLYNEGVKSYKEITQKVSSYNKEEKGKYDGLEIDNTSVIDVLGKANKRQVPKETQKAKKAVTINETKTVSPKVTTSTTQKQASSQTVTPPPYIPAEEEKKTKKKVARDYEFYRNMVTPPVMPMGNGMYREMNKKEVVDEREARKILGYADYAPKEQLNLIIFYIIALVGGFAFSLVGPVAIVAWGVFTKGKNTTVYEKKLQMGSLAVTMPATEQEKDNYQKRGQLYINVAIVIGVIQFIRLFYF